MSTSLLLTSAWHPRPALDPATGLPQGLPADATAEQTAYAQTLAATWQRHIPARPEDGQGDIEDWWESAARLDAGLRSGADHLLLLDKRDQTVFDVTPGLDEDQRLPAAAAETFYGSVTEHPEDSPHLYVHYGPIAQHSALWLRVGYAGDRYGYSQTFIAAAGRRTALVGTHLEEPEADSAAGLDLIEQMTAWAREGITDVVVKAVRAKHGIWRLPAHAETEVNAETVRSALGWALVRNEGRPRAYLLQEHVPMRFEYRLFIVDARPVTGAGCVVEHTPLFADHRPDASPFSPLMREHRGVDLRAQVEEELDNGTWQDPAAGHKADHGASRVVSDPDRVERYLAFATDFAIAAATEGVLPRAYTLDVATHGVTGEPLVVETNGLTNSGLYATHPRLVARALLATSPLLESR